MSCKSRHHQSQAPVHAHRGAFEETVIATNRYVSGSLRSRPVCGGSTDETTFFWPSHSEQHNGATS